MVKIKILLLLFLTTALSFGFISGDGKVDKDAKSLHNSAEVNTTSGKSGDAYRLYINNINLPLNRDGIIADVNIPDSNSQISGSGGKFDNLVFLFSSGFFLSGNANGQPWANAVASASLVEDYIHGTVQDGDSDPRAQLYVLKKSDVPFGESWQDWIDAVALGADFYDGDGDGQYNPIDINENGTWDPEEDSPDILGDETVWCVYNDGIPSTQRRWNTVSPLGIEVRQTVFAFASAGEIGNIIFIRYRVKYVGLGNIGEADQLDSVYFGVWADPDIGEPNNDLGGVDVYRNAGFVYNDGVDAVYGEQSPCFIIDFLSGPAVYIEGETFTDNNNNGTYDEGIDTPLDTAISVRGKLLGITEIPGAKNLPITSAINYMNSDPTLGDPENKEQARNYMLGMDRVGNYIDPCTWAYGEVKGGVNCTNIDSKFWYSGDPVTNIGWINTAPLDYRQLQNTGPITLIKGVENEIIVAYVIGQDNNAIDAITKAREIDDDAQIIFDNNFDELSTGINDDKNLIADEFKLYQNYPNPFNPSTTIKFTVPQSVIASEARQSHEITSVNSFPRNDNAVVQLKVYDILGREIKTLVNEQKPAGTYKIQFDASKLSSGVYFYQLSTASYVQTKKLMLLK